MTTFRLLPILTVTTAALAATTASAATKTTDILTSIYTDLTEKTCVVLEEADEYVTGPTYECPGVGGYKLRTYDYDLRSNLSVVDPKGKEQRLDLPVVIHPGYSILGARAEWRVVRKNGKVIPKALIVRYIVSQSPELEGGEFKYVHFLAVAKITPNRNCVTDRITASATMNVLARKAAGGASSKSCLPPVDLESL